MMERKSIALASLLTYLLAFTQASASQLLDIEKNAVSIPITVSVVGEGKNATRWQAVRKAQMMLAQELPSVVQYTTQIRNADIDLIIHETLAQTVSMQVESMEIKVFKLGEAKTPEFRGTHHNRYDINLDDGDNPLGTLYRAEASFTFLVLPAALVERARLLEDNQQLAKEMERRVKGDGTAQGHYHSNLLLLERLNQASLDNPKLKKLDAEIRQHGKSKNFTAGLDALAKGVEGLGKLDIKMLSDARREGDLSFYRNREHYIGQKITEAHIARKQSLDNFVKSLPAAFANTIKVVSAELIEPPTKLVIQGGRIKEVSTVGSFGYDFLFSSHVLKEFEETYGKREVYQAPPTTILNIELDPSCKIGGKRSAARLNMCELWDSLPIAIRNRIEVEGLYAGDYRYEGVDVRNLIEGDSDKVNEVLRMPTATYDKSLSLDKKISHFGERGLRAGFRIIKTKHYNYMPAGRSLQKELTEKHTLADISSLSANLYYGMLRKVVPDLIAAGFVERPPITMTVLFPAAKQYIDVPLTSNQYLLRNRFISIVIQDENPNPETDRLRKQDIRVVVWWSGDDGSLSHPSESDWQPIAGGLHYANLPYGGGDVEQLDHMDWLRENYKELENSIAASHQENFMMEGAIFNGWFNGVFGRSNESKYSDRLILQYGRKPDIKMYGFPNLAVFHNLKSKSRNNPMANTDNCHTLHPVMMVEVNCSDYFNSMEYPTRKTFVPRGGRHLKYNFWESVNSGLTGSFWNVKKLAKDRGLPEHTYFMDVHSGETKIW